MELRERLVELAITGVPFTGVLAIFLILIFVGKEAIPLFIDAEALKEVSPNG